MGPGGGRVKCCLAPPRAPLFSEREIFLSCAQLAHNHVMLWRAIWDLSVFIRWRTSPGAQPPKDPLVGPVDSKRFAPQVPPENPAHNQPAHMPFNSKNQVVFCIYICCAQPCAQYLVWGRFGDFWDAFWGPFGISSWKTQGVCTFAQGILRTTPGAQPFLEIRC